MEMGEKNFGFNLKEVKALWCQLPKEMYLELDNYIPVPAPLVAKFDAVRIPDYSLFELRRVSPLKVYSLVGLLARRSGVQYLTWLRLMI